MTKAKVQSIRELRDEMIAVSRGERTAPKDAARPSFESADAVTRLLTPENRTLIAAIRDYQPASVTALAKQVHRAVPNVHRALERLATAGLVRLVQARTPRRRVYPVVVVRKINIEIHLNTSEHDTVRMTLGAATERSGASRSRRRATPA